MQTILIGEFDLIQRISVLSKTTIHYVKNVMTFGRPLVVYAFKSSTQWTEIGESLEF